MEGEVREVGEALIDPLLLKTVIFQYGERKVAFRTIPDSSINKTDNGFLSIVLLILERGEGGREEEREKRQCEKETLMGCLPHMSRLELQSTS